jgi:AraC family transcriptional regulator
MNRPRVEVERAVSHIQGHLGASLTVAQIASAAGLSEFHLHRVFHAAIGESVGRFITRKRLEMAALRLACEPSTPVTTIGLDVGYSSSSNFAKAFKLYFGVSPMQVRNPVERVPDGVFRLLEEYGHAFVPERLFAVRASDDEARRQEAKRWQEDVRFEQVEPLLFTCLASPNGYASRDLMATWAELIDRCRQLGVCDAEVDAWGIAYDSPDLTAPNFCRYHACVRGQPRQAGLPPPLFEKTVAPGRFAVFSYRGPVDGVAAAYRSVYSCWFPESSLVPADYLPMDRYVADEPTDGRVEMEMWFRVE